MLYAPVLYKSPYPASTQCQPLVIRHEKCVKSTTPTVLWWLGQPLLQAVIQVIEYQIPHSVVFSINSAQPAKMRYKGVFINAVQYVVGILYEYIWRVTVISFANQRRTCFERLSINIRESRQNFASQIINLLQGFYVNHTCNGIT